MQKHTTVDIRCMCTAGIQMIFYIEIMPQLQIKYTILHYRVRQ